MAGITALLKEAQESAMYVKQQDSVQEETSGVSATMGIKVESRHPRIHPPSELRKDGETFSRRKRPRGRSPSGKSNRKTCRDSQREVHETIV